ncbi:hypothetical protein ACFFGV_09910 [Pontibacillus salicampi]|uniref:Uncharacterized protein n=1 Tax=Pontibacillus salicampi TaxID=1449801 RepID=A0ABV6LN96_9BACI
MKQFFKKRLFWIVPLCIVLLSFGFVFFQQIEAISKGPAADWSRKIPLGETATSQPPYQYQNNNEHHLVQLVDGRLVTTTLDKNLHIIGQDSIPSPFQKWRSFYYQGDALLYFDNKQIKSGQGDVITDAEEFHPTPNGVVYQHQGDIYSLDPDNFETTKLFTLPKGHTLLPIQKYKEPSSLIFTYRSEGNTLETSLYQLNESTYSNVHNEDMQFEGTEEVSEVSMAYDEDNISVLVQTEKRKFNNLISESHYLSQTKRSNPSFKYEEITLPDPITHDQLEEIRDVHSIYKEDGFHVLFKGYGNTKRSNTSTSSFNVYELSKKDNEVEVGRRSHSYRLVSNPVYINENSIVWNEMTDPRTMYVSSSKKEVIDAAKGYTKDDALIALGNAMSMYSRGVLTISLVTHWFVWPLVFFAILFLFFKRFTDEDKRWVLYAAIGIYMAASFMWKNHFFLPSFERYAPDIFTFTGSSYVLLLFFAVISYLCLQLTSKEWGSALKATYFIGVHITLVVFILGPYVIMF